MKRTIALATFITALTLIFCTAPIEARVTPTPTQIDYIQQGTALISQRVNDINTFITLYNLNKQYFSTFQDQQIESQYNGLLHAFTSIKDNLSKDTGANLQDDYSQITANIPLYTISLPLLYSENVLFKEEFLMQKANELNTKLIPQVIRALNKTEYQQSLNLTQQVTQALQGMSVDTNNVTAYYSQIANIQAGKETSKTDAQVKSLFASIQANQTDFLHQYDAFNTALTGLINLY